MPEIIFNKVVLPEAEGPVTANNPPLENSSELILQAVIVSFPVIYFFKMFSRIIVISKMQQLQNF